MRQHLAFVRLFAHEHDDIPAFHAMFLVLAFVTASLLNLGAFGLLIVAHMALDYVKYRDVHGYGLAKTLKGVIHESIMDITLLMIGLVISVYFHHSVGVAHVSGLLRAEMTIIRGLGLLIPKLAILERVLKIAVHIRQYAEHIHPQIEHGWSRLDFFSFFIISMCISLLLLAGPIMRTDPSVIQWIVLWELIPWNV